MTDPKDAYPDWFRLGQVYVPVTTPSGQRAVVSLDKSVREPLREALAEYRRWGNSPTEATSYVAVGAGALTRLDAIAKLCDALLDRLDGHPWPSAQSVPPGLPDPPRPPGAAREFA